MDNKMCEADPIGATALNLPSISSETVTGDYSPDDEDLDEAAAAAVAASEATRDTLADGLVASLLRPCVDRLDASVQSTRLSQLDLKLQLDSLAAELKRLSLAQHDYLFATTSISSPQSPISAHNTLTAATKTATDTCALLDGYARRLCDGRAKIAVVGNILESTQERLRALSHRIGREHNNRRSLLEPQAAVIDVADELELEEENEKNIENIDEVEEINDNKEEVQPNKNLLDSNKENEEEEQKPGEIATVIATSQSASETS